MKEVKFKPRGLEMEALPIPLRGCWCPEAPSFGGVNFAKRGSNIVGNVFAEPGTIAQKFEEFVGRKRL